MDDIHILLNDLKKEFGEDSICILGEDDRLSSVETRPSGSLAFDVALGGGLGKGVVTEYRGENRTGKSTLMCINIAEAQANEPDKICAIIDLEHTFNPEWAKLLGVDLDKLLFSQPDKPAEGVYDILENMVKSNKFSIIGLDSLAGLVAKEEYENDDWDKESRIGGTSKINSKAIRKIVNTGLLKRSGTSLIMINQLRDLIGGYSPYGTLTTTPGGRALKHAFCTQVDVSTGDYFTKGSGKDTKYFGQQICLRVVKNKIGPPFRRAILDIYYDRGLDKLTDTVNVGKSLGVLSGAGAWLTAIDPRSGEVMLYNGKEMKFNGAEKTKEALLENIQNADGKMYEMIVSKIREILKRE